METEEQAKEEATGRYHFLLTVYELTSVVMPLVPSFKKFNYTLSHHKSIRILFLDQTIPLN